MKQARTTHLAVIAAAAFFFSFALGQVDEATGTVTNDATMACLRVANLVFDIDSPNVDLLVNGEIPVNGSVPQADLFAGYIGGYLYLESGTYNVAVVPTIEGVDAALVGPLDMALKAGHRYTLAMMGRWMMRV